MIRYFMSASNGPVVASESKTGGWVRFENYEAALAEKDAEIADLRFLTSAYDAERDKILAELTILDLDNKSKDMVIKELQAALDELQECRKNYKSAVDNGDKIFAELSTAIT